jgi:hypothetical protein
MDDEAPYYLEILVGTVACCVSEIMLGFKRRLAGFITEVIIESIIVEGRVRQRLFHPNRSWEERGSHYSSYLEIFTGWES